MAEQSGHCQPGKMVMSIAEPVWAWVREGVQISHHMPVSVSMQSPEPSTITLVEMKKKKKKKNFI